MHKQISSKQLKKVTRFETNKSSLLKTMSLHQKLTKFIFLHHVASSSASPQDVNTSWYVTFDSSSEN